jgi:NifU-like protein
MASRPEDRIVCRCFVVPEERIRKAISEHSLRQVEEVTAVTRAGGGCSSCWDEIQVVLDEVWGRPPGRDVPDASGLSAAQKRARIVAALADGAEALLGLNGIQLQLVDVAGDRVLVRFFGDAVGTQAASYLALKKELVRTLSDACGQKMNLVELNVLESLAKAAPTT